MSLAFCSLSSGSSGNSYLIKTENTAVLIDAGISASRILKELARTDTPRENVRALLLTHEHIDHVRGARVLLKKLCSAAVYSSPGTLDGTIRHDIHLRLSFEKEIEPSRRFTITPDEVVSIGDLKIRAFRTLHDAKEPYGYYITSADKSIALLTDTGIVTDEIIDSVKTADVLVLESNHDTDMLRYGRYPYYLKQRILSDYGHLSNNQAAEALIKLFDRHDKKRVVLLAHLSKENNSPSVAEQTVLAALARKGFSTGSDLYMGVLKRDEASLLYQL